MPKPLSPAYDAYERWPVHLVTRNLRSPELRWETILIDFLAGPWLFIFSPFILSPSAPHNSCGVFCLHLRPALSSFFKVFNLVWGSRGPSGESTREGEKQEGCVKQKGSHIDDTQLLKSGLCCDGWKGRTVSFHSNHLFFFIFFCFFYL